jgi:hypothetical protein
MSFSHQPKQWELQAIWKLKCKIQTE